MELEIGVGWVVFFDKLESTPTTGSILTSLDDKKLFAKRSKDWNRSQTQFRGERKGINLHVYWLKLIVSISYYLIPFF